MARTQRRRLSMMGLMAAAASMALVAACSSAPAQSSGTGDSSSSQTAAADGSSDTKAPSAEPRELKVGLLWGISGAYAQVTEDFFNGVQYGLDLHADELAAANISVEQIKADTEGTPNVGVSAYQKLSTKDDVDVVLGPLSSNVALAVLPHASQDGVPMIVTGTAPSLSQNGWSAFHRGTYPNEYQTTAMMQYVTSELGWKSIVIINQDSEYGNDLRDKSVAFAGDHSVDVLDTIAYEPGTTNFLSIATKAKNAAPDGVIVAGLGAESAAVIKQVLDAGFKSNQIASYGGTDAESVNAVIPANQREGILLITVFDANADALKDRPEVKQFVSTYQSQHGAVPQLYATLGVLQIEAVIDAALHVDGEIDRTSMLESIDQRRPYQSVVGELQMSESHELIMPLYIQAYDSEGEPRPVYTFAETL